MCKDKLPDVDNEYSGFKFMNLLIFLKIKKINTFFSKKM